MSGGRHASPARLIRRPWAVAAALIGVMLVCGAVAGLAWAGHTGRAATPVGKPPLVPVPRGTWAAAAQALSAAVSRPNPQDLPAIGANPSPARLALTPAGALQVPSSTAVAGWYTDSPRPGAIGASVI